MQIESLSCPEGPITIKWPYFNRMQFLKDVLNIKNISENSLAATAEDELRPNSTSPSAGDEDSNNESEFPTNCSLIKSEFSESMIQIQDLPRKRSNSESDPLEIDKKKMHFNTNTQQYQDDEDYYFLMSLLSSIKQLDQLEKMKLRMSILKEVTDALEAHNSVNQSPQVSLNPPPLLSYYPQHQS